MPSPRTVLALGGNALIRPGELGSPADQGARAREVARQLATLPRDTELVVTHGNGPQVGRILLRSDLTASELPEVPLDLAVAATQGQIGVMLQHALGAAMRRPSCTVLTSVVVDPEDPDFTNPTKFVGRFYTREQAEERAAELGWRVREDAGRGWRRVVPSPLPISIVELAAIRTLVKAGHVVVACGGGGVPVMRAHGVLAGVEAVVDKDRASALLARELGATRLIILTAVDEVMVDFAGPQARALRELDADELRHHYDQGQFPPGSMGPKIEAALDFLELGPGATVLITSPECFGQALLGERGTWIHRL